MEENEKLLEEKYKSELWGMLAIGAGVVGAFVTGGALVGVGLATEAAPLVATGVATQSAALAAASLS